jgi:hypothetical protein
MMIFDIDTQQQTALIFVSLTSRSCGDCALTVALFAQHLEFVKYQNNSLSAKRQLLGGYM